MSGEEAESHSLVTMRSSSAAGERLTVGAVNPQNLQAGKENLGMANVLLDQVDGDVQSAA